MTDIQKTSTPGGSPDSREARRTAHPDGKRHTLRLLGDQVSAALERAGTDPAAIPEVATAWRELLVALDLGVAPALTRCPACGATAMAAATRCGFCWEAMPATAAPPVP